MGVLVEVVKGLGEPFNNPAQKGQAVAITPSGDQGTTALVVPFSPSTSTVPL